MTKTRLQKLLALIHDLDDHELVEVRAIITSTLTTRRSLQILTGDLERPGKRGKRWKRPATKKHRPEGEGLRSK